MHTVNALKGRYVFIDFETSGLDPAIHSPLEIALVVVEDGRVLDSYRREIYNENPVADVRAMEINGLHINPPGALHRSAIQLQVKQFLRQYFDEPVTLVGQNVPFDVGFLKALFVGSTTPYHEIFSHRHIDTSVLYQFFYRMGLLAKGGSLGDIAKNLGIEVSEEQRHTALGDCLLTLQVLNAMVELVSPLKEEA